MNLSVDSAEKLPVAKICGEPLMEIPQDLYIPPDALKVFLDTFQGPLDLLLYLIRKHNLEILDIPMAELTRQYMAYVEIMRINQLELAAEYLLMTALLIEIKSRMLLPNPVTKAEDERDPRADLVRRLLEYEKIKLAALRLNELPQIERDFSAVQVWIKSESVVQLPHIDINDLQNAWITLMARAKINRHHQINREALSVRTYMSRILRRLHEHTQVAFHELFSPAVNTAEAVVTFLALLELAKEALVEITQSEVFGIIYVKSIDITKSG